MEPAEAFEQLRAELQALQTSAMGKGVNREPADGKLHINLGWYSLWKQVDLPKQLCLPTLDSLHTELNNSLQKEFPKGIPLGCPHLSHYPDMASFPDNCSVEDDAKENLGSTG